MCTGNLQERIDTSRAEAETDQEEDIHEKEIGGRQWMGHSARRNKEVPGMGMTILLMHNGHLCSLCLQSAPPCPSAGCTSDDHSLLLTTQIL